MTYTFTIEVDQFDDEADEMVLVERTCTFASMGEAIDELHDEGNNPFIFLHAPSVEKLAEQFEPNLVEPAPDLSPFADHVGPIYLFWDPPTGNPFVTTDEVAIAELLVNDVWSEPEVQSVTFAKVME